MSIQPNNAAEAEGLLSLLGNKSGFNIINSVILWLMGELWRSNYPNYTITKSKNNERKFLETGDHAFFFDSNNVFYSGFYVAGDHTLLTSWDIQQSN